MGRARVGRVTGHQGSTILLKFISDVTWAVSCVLGDLEELCPVYLEESPLNVLSDTIDELRTRF